MSGTQFNAVGPHLISLFLYVFGDGVKLVYSWILPTETVSEAWLHTKESSKKHVLSGRFDSQKIRNLLALMVQGKSFFDCCVLADISTEKVPDVLRNWSLAPNLYAYRNQCIFPPKNEWSSDDGVFVSPSSNTLAEVESVFLLDKLSLIKDSTSFQDICELLKHRTGLSFLKTQVGRLGNIEWFSLPAGGIFEDHRIDFYLEKCEDSQEQVSIELSAKHRGEFLVNVRCKAADTIVLDELFSVEAQGDEVSIKTPPCERPNSVHLRIWKKTNSSWKLYHEVSGSFFSSFSISSNIHYPVETPVASEISAIQGSNNSLSLRIKKLISYAGPAATPRRYGNVSAFKQSIDRAKEVAALVSPEKSSSLFLPKGYEGKVEFYEWLKNVPSGIEDLKRLIIIDPYLDEEAILFIPYFNDPRIDFTLIANTKIVNDGSKKRANIISQAELVKRSASTLNISIYDVIKDKQIIHDRYILLQDKSGRFCRGFNLSNSIQMANKNYPLLICEIPLDVLSSVQDWVGYILNDGKELEKIWSSTLNVAPAAPKPQKSIASTANFTRADIRRMIPERWFDVANAAYGNNTIKARVAACVETLSDRKINNLIDYVIKHLDQLVSSDDAPSSKFISNYCALSVPAEILSQALNIGRLHSLYTNPPPVSLLISEIIDNRPESVLTLFQKIFSYTGSDEVKCKVLSNFLSYVHLQVEFAFNLDFWISIGDFRISAIAALKVGSMIENEISVYDACSKIAVFDVPTQFLILLRWTSDLRTKARYLQSSQPDISDRVKELLVELKLKAPTSMSIEEVQSVIINLGGPGKGWAIETVNDLFIDLIQRNVVSIEDVANALFELTIKDFDSERHFSEFSSGSLFEATGWAVSLLEAEDIKQKLARMSLNAHVNALREPFLYSISFEKYNHANISLHKKLIVLMTILKHRKQLENNIDDLMAPCGKYYEFLKRRNLLFTTSNSELNTALKRLVEMFELG